MKRGILTYRRNIDKCHGLRRRVTLYSISTVLFPPIIAEIG